MTETPVSTFLPVLALIVQLLFSWVMVMLPVFIVLENLTVEVLKLDIRSCLKWKGAAHTGLKLPLKMVVRDGGFALPLLIIIISQPQKSSKNRNFNSVWWILICY
jgi:hypothetical protein